MAGVHGNLRLAALAAVFSALAVPGVAPRAQTVPSGNAETQVGLRLTVEPRELEVGDTLKVTVEFRQVGTGSGLVIRDPALPTPRLFEIRGSSRSSRITLVNDRMMNVTTTQFTLKAVRAGQETVGPAVLVYEDPREGRREIQSAGALVTVRERNEPRRTASPAPAPREAASPPEAGDLRDLKPLLPGRVNFLKFLLLLLVFFLTAGWIARRLLAPRPRREVAPSAAGYAALRLELATLAKEADLPDAEFALRLSALVRGLLTHRRGASFRESTTEEIAEALAKSGVPEAEREAWLSVLRAADGVLYADGRIAPGEREEWVRRVEGLVR